MTIKWRRYSCSPQTGPQSGIDRLDNTHKHGRSPAAYSSRRLNPSSGRERSAARMSGSAAAFCVTFKLASRAICGAILGIEETLKEEDTRLFIKVLFRDLWFMRWN
jgi:hypothetical protein